MARRLPSSPFGIGSIALMGITSSPSFAFFVAADWEGTFQNALDRRISWIALLGFLLTLASPFPTRRIGSRPIVARRDSP